MRRAVFALVAFAVSACAGGMSNPAVQQRASDFAAEMRPQAATPAFGVGYASEPQISGEDGFSWSKTLCALPGSSFASCPQYVYGHRSAGPFTASKSVDKLRVGSASISVSGSSALGTSTFSQLLSSDEPKRHAGYENYDVAEFNWTDAFTPVSSTLPKDTKVKFTVTLTVDLSTTDVSCLDSSATSLLFEASEVDTHGPGYLQVQGKCNGTGKNAKFVVTNGSGKSGGIAADSLIGYVGEKQTINGTGEVQTEIPCYSLCEAGSYAAGLAGSATYTIVPVTSGVTFTTASGATY